MLSSPADIAPLSWGVQNVDVFQKSEILLIPIIRLTTITHLAKPES